MKLLSYRQPTSGEVRVALIDGTRYVDLALALGTPADMLGLLQAAGQQAGEEGAPLDWLRHRWEEAQGDIPEAASLEAESVELVAPLPRPTSLRDFYAFEQHVRDARARRGLDMIPEWYDFPVFYFSNHGAILGPGEVVEIPKGCEWFDYELEVAAVIGREGRDIAAGEAGRYIAGYTILNDWSARDIQRQEMKVGLGPAKGKDFATSLGPWLVTPDELAGRQTGKGYDLAMIARRNGEELSRGNWRTLHYSFGEMIERASANVTLYPGDVIGSGTVGTGCILELGPDGAGGWLRPGDQIELEIERLGILSNRVEEGKAAS